MNSNVPKNVVKSIETAKKMITRFRVDLQASMAEPAKRARLNRSSVHSLYKLAVQEPSSIKLASLLVELVPSSVMGFDGGKSFSPVSAPIGARMMKLCAALLEAGLAEQLHADGTFRTGNALKASALEYTLDDWLERGRYRQGFEDAPLSRIDQMIAMNGATHVDQAELIETRFGLLVPVIANIHLWHLLENLSPAQGRDVGWCDQNTQHPEQPPVDSLAESAVTGDVHHG